MIDDKIVVYGQEPLNASTSGCNFYRIRQPLDEIRSQDLLPCELSSDLSIPDQELWMDKCDVFVTQMAKTRKLLDYMIWCKSKKIDKKFVFDSDDNLFYVSPYNPAYLYYGVDEVSFELEGGKKVEIKDKENGFGIDENKELLKVFGQCLKWADMVTTPSPVLSGFYKKFNKNTVVIKNFLNLKVWKPFHQLKDDRIRILWQGCASHYEDILEIQPVLETIIKKHSNVDLIIFGQMFDGVLVNIPKERIIHERYVNIDAYPYKLRTLNADIGIAPIKNNMFNSCKSEIKWEEYSALEIPCVASNIPPYSLAIDDGRTGFLCGDTQDWIETLEKLIKDANLRKTIGQRARVRIEQDYDMEKNAVQYVDAYKSLFKKKLILV